MASAVGDVVGPGCSAGNGAGTGAGTGAGMGAGARGDADGPEGAVGKVDITTPDKTNNTPILVSY